MTQSRQVLLSFAAAAAGGLAGCSSKPPADPAVYEVRRVPVTMDSPLVSDRPVVTEYDVARTVQREATVQSGSAPAAVPSASATRPYPQRSVADELEDEYARRTWIEANYGRRQVAETQYVPQQEPVRERVIVVENEPRRWVPPITLGLGYWWGGHHGHHDSNWGWGLSTAIPIW